MAEGPIVDDLAEAIAALRASELVVFPTETFYGIAADAASPDALARLFAVKQREAGKPVALIAADCQTAFGLAHEVPADARRLADAFWPGPLTIVFPARDGMPSEILGDDRRVGVRVSSHPIARALAAGLGRSITATSANLAGEPPATALAEARRALRAKIKVYLEGGTLAGGAPSSVVAIDTAGWRVLRAGAISERQIAAILTREACR
jgi:L-threonylcarbamoyladenylate synthase